MMEYLDRKDIASIAIRKMMKLFKECFYRGDNSGDSKTCKFHSHLHTTSNMVE